MIDNISVAATFAASLIAVVPSNVPDTSLHNGIKIWA
jgi:hypothetical protein